MRKQEGTHLKLALNLQSFVLLLQHGYLALPLTSMVHCILHLSGTGLFLFPCHAHSYVAELLLVLHSKDDALDQMTGWRLTEHESKGIHSRKILFYYARSHLNPDQRRLAYQETLCTQVEYASPCSTTDAAVRVTCMHRHVCVCKSEKHCTTHLARAESTDQLLLPQHHEPLAQPLVLLSLEGSFFVLELLPLQSILSCSLGSSLQGAYSLQATLPLSSSQILERCLYCTQNITQ